MLTNGERDFIESVMAPLGGAAQDSEHEQQEPRLELELDLRGMPMPMAYLRVRRVLRRLPAGQQLLVLANDDESTRGFPALARLCKHDVTEQRTDDGDHLFAFRRR
jgi:TusA-related sulfurtransferase